MFATLSIPWWHVSAFKTITCYFPLRYPYTLLRTILYRNKARMTGGSFGEIKGHLERTNKLKIRLQRSSTSKPQCRLPSSKTSNLSLVRLIMLKPLNNDKYYLMQHLQTYSVPCYFTLARCH